MTVYGITAATGHYGTELIAELQQRGVSPSDIVAYGRNATKLQAFQKAGIQTTLLDYSTATVESSARDFAGIDRLLIIPSSATHGRVEENTTLIHAARAARVGHVFYLSFIGASEFPDNPLTPDHAATEDVLNASAIPHLSIRNGFYLDNYLGSLPGIKASGKLFSAAGEGVINGATRADLAKAGAALLTEDAPRVGIVTLGGPGATKAEHAKAISQGLGLPVELVNVNYDELKQGMVDAGLPEPRAAVMAQVDVATAHGALATHSTLLEELLGHRPHLLVDVLTSKR